MTPVERTEQRLRALRRIKALSWFAAALFVVLGFLGRADRSTSWNTFWFLCAALFTVWAVLMTFARLAPETEADAEQTAETMRKWHKARGIALRLCVFLAFVLVLLLLFGWLKDNHLAWFARGASAEVVNKART